MRSDVMGVHGAWRIVVALALAVAMHASNALAQSEVSFDIPAQPLERALAAFQSQGKVQVLYAPDIVSGLQAPAISGRMTPRQALDRLIEGSGLVAVASGSGWLIRKAQPRSASDAELPLVSVESTQDVDSPVGPDADYVARRSLAATKTDTPLLETPRSVSVITATQIDDQKVDEIGAALRYTPGVFAEHRGADTTRPHLIMRGFRDLNPVYVDGLQGFSSSFNSIAPELYGLERVEVLRGPASSLYGNGSPGGIVNGVTKRPREEFFAEVEGSYGSYDQVGGKFDIGGALDDQKKFLFRLTGAAHGGDTQINYLEDDRLYIAPAFTWKIGADTTLTLLTQYQKDDTYEVQLLPAAGTVLPNPNGTIPTSFLVAEPGYTAYQKEATSLGYLFEHKFSETFALRQSLRQEYRDLLFRTQGGNGYLGDLRTLDRGVFTVQDDVDALTTDTSVLVGLETGAIRHTLLLGVDYKRATTNEDMFYIDGPDIDVFNPVYGQAVPTPPQDWDQQQKLSQTGIYLQDQMKFGDKVVLTLGGRSDRARIRTTETFTATDTDEKHDALTWQGGLVYLFGNGLAPYVSYAESFEPAGGTDRNGVPFDPTTGTQYEAGVKYQPPGTSLLASVAVFELTQQNVLTTDPIDINFSTQTGEIRSRGIEVEAKTSLASGLNLTASYSFTDLEVTKSNDGDQGTRPTRVPEHLASAWADYQFQGGALHGFGAGAGVRYVGSTFGDWENTFKVPAFTLVDAALHYDFRDDLKGMRLSLNASNLFDKTYVASCEAESYCIYGLRRVVTAAVKYRW